MSHIYIKLADYLKEEKSSDLDMPKVFYHGTNVEFDRFDVKHKGKNFKSSELGIYFSQYKNPPPYSSTAKEYAEDTVRISGGTPVIYECELLIKNPLVLDSNGWYSSNTYIDVNRHDIKRWLGEEDYDSVVVYDFKVDDVKERDYIVVVFDPDQIKIVGRS